MRASMLVAMALLPISGLGQNEQIDRVVSYLRGDWLRADLSIVTPDIRDEVITRLRNAGGGPLQQINGAGTIEYVLLMRLGDEETMKQIADTTRSRWLTGKGWAFQGLLAESAQPAVIPLIAPDFFRSDGDKIEYGHDEDIAYTKRPFSIEMSRVAFRVIADSDAFAPDTREWARENLRRTDSTPPGVTREVVQEWWRKNQAYFRVADYRAVRLGQLLSAPPGTAPDSVAPSSQTPHTVSPAAPVSTPTAAAPVPVTSSAKSSTPSGALPWAGAAVMAALFAGLFIIWKRRA